MNTLPANFGKPWTLHEDDELLAEFDTGMSIEDMARKHSRTQSSVRLRLEKLGRIQRPQEP